LPTPPDGVTWLCSKEVNYTAACTGTGQVSPLIYAWEVGSITIRGVALTLTTSDPKAVAFLGNGGDPDVMLRVVGNENRIVMYPSGFGFWFNGPGGGSHLDIHVTCAKGGSFIAQAVYFYTNNGASTPNFIYGITPQSK
jgi:hypothetical protein